MSSSTHPAPVCPESSKPEPERPESEPELPESEPECPEPEPESPELERLKFGPAESDRSTIACAGSEHSDLDTARSGLDHSAAACSEPGCSAVDGAGWEGLAAPRPGSDRSTMAGVTSRCSVIGRAEPEGEEVSSALPGSSGAGWPSPGCSVADGAALGSSVSGDAGWDRSTVVCPGAEPSVTAFAVAGHATVGCAESDRLASACAESGRLVSEHAELRNLPAEGLESNRCSHEGTSPGGSVPEGSKAGETESEHCETEQSGLEVLGAERSESDRLNESERTELVRPRVVLAMARDVWPQVFDAAVRDRLVRVADVDLDRVVDDFADPAHADALARAEVLLTCWGCPPLTAEVLDRMPALRAVVHAAGTVKHHVTEACWERGISVSSAAAANALPVAEFTLAAILFAGKRVLPIAARYRRDRARPEWADSEPGWGNYRVTVGVVGASLIGRRVIELLRPFDIEVLVFDPFLGEDEARELGVHRAELPALAAAADVVSVHAPQIPETRHMIDRRILRLMRDGATLINTARGSLVDTDALTEELVAGRLHAVLDVTEPEVLPASSPLYDLPNVLLTPHIAGSLGNELARMAGSALDELERLARGVPFVHPVRADALAHTA